MAQAVFTTHQCPINVKNEGLIKKMMLPVNMKAWDKCQQQVLFLHIHVVTNRSGLQSGYRCFMLCYGAKRYIIIKLITTCIAEPCPNPCQYLNFMWGLLLLSVIYFWSVNLGKSIVHVIQVTPTGHLSLVMQSGISG